MSQKCPSVRIGKSIETENKISGCYGLGGVENEGECKRVFLILKLVVMVERLCK